MSEVKPGTVWRHLYGGVYTVLAIANTAHPSEKFPPAVVYVGANGNVWTRPLSEWTADKFSVLHDGGVDGRC